MSEYIIEAEEGCFGTGTLVGELVRCGDCKYFDDRPGWQSCQAFGNWFGEEEMGANDYCSKGEKK